MIPTRRFVSDNRNDRCETNRMEKKTNKPSIGRDLNARGETPDSTPRARIRPARVATLRQLMAAAAPTPFVLGGYDTLSTVEKKVCRASKV
jgi:hypothetical protein